MLQNCDQGCGRRHYGGNHRNYPRNRVAFISYHTGGSCRWCGQPLGNRPVRAANRKKGYHDSCAEQVVIAKVPA